MTEQLAEIDVQPASEPFQTPPMLEMIRAQTNGTPESIKQYFETLSFDDFSGLLNGLNAYFRGISGPHKMDGYGLMADGYMPPDPNDRAPLLKEAFEKAVQADSPEKCATILGMSILTIHPYLDGNGRTSRTIFALLTNGYSGSNEDKVLFSEIGAKDEDEEGNHHSGYHVIDLDPSGVKVGDRWLSYVIYGGMKELAIVNRFGTHLPDLPIRVGHTNADRKYNQESHLNAEEQLELNDMFGSNALAFVACINALSDELYGQSLYHVNFDGNEYNVISYKNIINDITRNELSDLRTAFRQARIDYVRQLMNIADREDFQTIFQQYRNTLNEWKIENQHLEK